MKKLIFSFVLTVLSCFWIMAQVPQGFNYQAVARDASGNELTNVSLTVKITIRSGSATGIVVWEGTHVVTTNEFGLFSLVIGQGTGGAYNFADIDWGNNTHFLNVQINDGSNFIDMGTTQLLSVPYALYAEDEDADTTNEIQDLQLNGNILTITLNGSPTKIDLNPYLDNTDNQQLGIDGYQLTIERGNTITLPDSLIDDDADPTNELQSLSLSVCLQMKRD